MMEQMDAMTALLEQLRAGYECEVHLYSRVREIAHLQAKLLGDGCDAFTFLRLAGEQEKLLDSIAGVDRTLTPARMVVANEYDLIGEERLCELNAVLDELCLLIEEIRELETRSYSLVGREDEQETVAPAFQADACAALEHQEWSAAACPSNGPRADSAPMLN